MGAAITNLFTALSTEISAPARIIATVVIIGIGLTLTMMPWEHGAVRFLKDAALRVAVGLAIVLNAPAIVGRAFQRESIVLLQGMAGVGKTEVAMGFARWRAETGGLDGPIFFFRFEHYLPLAQVCDRVGQVFRQAIKDQLHAEWHLLDAEQRRRVTLTLLRQVPCLLIWDNFEPVAGFPAGAPSNWTNAEQQDLRRFLQELRGGQTKVLLTSRRDEAWIGPIYQRVELRGLRLTEAQELAIKVLERTGLSTSQLRVLPDYNDVLEYLGGNPLAIQVALPELRRQTPKALLAAVQTGEVQLSGDDAMLGRERSLGASLGYRLDMLDPSLRQRLGVLALFQGFVGADVLAVLGKVEGAPELIRGLERDAWVQVLDAAAEVGLLQRVGAGYYTVHPALPWFFHGPQEAAFPTQQEWLEQAFAEAYGDYGRFLIRLFQTRAETAMSLLAAEEDNLRHALRQARRHEQWAALEGMLYGLSQLMVTQGRRVEWDRLISELEADVTDAHEEPLVGREGLWRALLGHRQEIAAARRDFTMQEAINQRLREHYARAGDQRNLAVCLSKLGDVARGRRQWDEAEQYYRQSLAIEERTRDEQGQASSLHQLGTVAEERQQRDEAEGWYRQSMAIRERIRDEQGQGSSLHQLGMVAHQRRQWEKAEEYYRQSLAITERIGDEHGQAVSLHLLGRVAEERGNAPEAVRLYEAAATLFNRLNDPYNLEIVRGSLRRIRGEETDGG